MAEGDWVRVYHPGVGKATQHRDAPLREGWKVIDEEAVDGTGRPLADEPDDGGRKSSGSSKTSKEG